MVSGATISGWSGGVSQSATATLRAIVQSTPTCSFSDPDAQENLLALYRVRWDR